MAFVCSPAEWVPCATRQVQLRQPSSRAESLISEPTCKPAGVTADGSVDFKGRAADAATTGQWRTAPTLFEAAMFEGVVNLGIAFNLSLYLQKAMHIPVIPALTAVSNYWGASYLTSLLGGFMSDAFLGNFWTIVVAMLIELVGVALLIISSTIPPLEPECVSDARGGCKPATKASRQWNVCMLALYLIAIGAGCIRLCLSAFAGNQFDQEEATERAQTPSFFNWLVVSITCGGIVATTLVVHLGENVSWTWSFASIGMAMMLATLCFLAGIGRYRHHKPAGSPLPRIVHVFTGAFRNRNLKLPADHRLLHELAGPVDSMVLDVGKPYYLLRHTSGLRWLDKAAIADGGERARPCTVTQVEEVKGLLRCLPIALSTMLLYMVIAQVQTWTTTQGYTMERHILGSSSSDYQIPPTTVSAIAIAIVVLFLAAYDFFLVPLLLRHTGNPHGLSHLQRIGTGLALSVVGLAYGALLESIRLDRSSMLLSILWQLPLLVIMGTAIFFAHAGLFEFFYYESPLRMRSTGTALSMLPIALGLFQNGGFMAAVHGFTGWLRDEEDLNGNHLNYFFLLMAVMSLVNFAVYLVAARNFVYKEFVNVNPTKPQIPHDESPHILL